MIGFLWTLVAVSAQEIAPVIEPEIVQAPLMDYSWLFIKVCVALIVVIASAFVFIKFLLPRLKGFNRSSRSILKIVDRNALEPRKNIYLIQVGERYFLLGTSDHSTSLIGELTKDEVDKAYTA